MILELKPEQQRLFELAASSGMSAEETMDQVFAVLQQQYESNEWMIADQATITPQIETGYAQAMAGEVVDAEEAIRMLQERRAHRKTD